jgi:hypothetical protein
MDCRLVPPSLTPRALAAASASRVRSPILRRSRSAKAANRRNRNGSVSAPSSTGGFALLLPSVITRRFPPPWIVEEHNDACFIVKDATGQALGYFCFEDEPGRRSVVKPAIKWRANYV